MVWRAPANDDDDGATSEPGSKYTGGLKCAVDGRAVGKRASKEATVCCRRRAMVTKVA